jgi:hypothetical protein
MEFEFPEERGRVLETVDGESLADSGRWPCLKRHHIKIKAY